MAGDIKVIWVGRQAIFRKFGNYFCHKDWTGQITLIRLNKSGFSRTGA
jgi:hypothetical protein